MSIIINVNLDKVALKECTRCHGTRKPIDNHHITYHKRVDKAHLCRRCHIGITVLNGIFSAQVNRELRNGERRRIYALFMEIDWRMEHEDRPLDELKRRRNMSYRRLLPKLQTYFKEFKL